MVLLHSRPLSGPHQSFFNLNKLRSMMFTKIKTGIALDADQWVNAGLDHMFQRAAEETSSTYPYPIMPVHWLSRDPEGPDGYSTYEFHFKSADAPSARHVGVMHTQHGRTMH